MRKGTEVPIGFVLAAASSYAIFDRDYAVRSALEAYVVAALAVVSFAFGLRSVARDGIRSTFLRTGSAVAHALVIAMILEWGLRRAEAMGAIVPGLASLATWALRALGADASAGTGMVFLADSSGAIPVASTLERLTPRPFVLAALMFLLARKHAPSVGTVLRSLCALAFVLLGGFVARLVALAGWNNLYSQDTGSVVLTVLGSLWITIPAVLLLGFLLERIRVAEPEIDASEGAEPIAWTTRLAPALGVAFVFLAQSLDPAGDRKSGRVLFDDGHNESWGRSDRRMDTEWFGDYSTYNLSAALEWIGHRYPVAAHRDRSLDDATLADVSVLVLKTPVKPFLESELAAIERFVANGGGLLVVGDHTDLNGMNTQLNRVLEPYRIRLGFDAVSEGDTGAFNTWERRLWPPSDAFLGDLETFEFMTSCTVSVDRSDAELMIVPRAALDEGDYANGSNFGARHSDPGLHTGPTILAAAVRHGRGRVSVFTDGTVLSGFAIYNDGHDDFLLSQIAWLSREALPWWATARIVLLLLGWSMIVMGFRYAAQPLPWMGVALVLTGIGTRSLHSVAYAPPAPDAGYHEAEFLWQGQSFAVPASLGSLGDLEPSLAFDTLCTNVARCGVWPSIVRSYDAALGEHARVLFVVNPVEPPPQSLLQRLTAFVNRGGHLIVLDRYGAYPGGSSANAYLAPFHVEVAAESRADGGVHLSPNGFTRHETRSELDLFVSPFGRGKVWFGVDSELWSRMGIGHAFSLPGVKERKRLLDLYELVRGVTGIDESDRGVFHVIEGKEG